MANTIDTKLMGAILDTPTWSLATKLSDRVIDRADVFIRPKPKPRPALAVPVDVQALYVPTRTSEKYVHLPLGLGDVPAHQKEPVAPFSQPKSRPAGVHLHWALPDGLLRGDMAETGDDPVNLPALPDRWLVTRMIGYRGQKRMNRRSWIIEAPSGRVFDLGDYPGDPLEVMPDDIDPDALNGLTGGSPNWTASYDASYGRFAFHDDLKDVVASRVVTKMATYVVMGWWSEQANDPMRRVYSSFAAGRKLAEFGWSASRAPLVVNRKSQTEWGGYDAFLEPAAGKHVVEVEAELKSGVSLFALQNGFEGYTRDKVAVPRKVQLYETVMHGVVYGVPVTGGIAKDAAPRARDIKLSLAPSLERLMAAQASASEGITAKREREYYESLMTAVGNGSIMHLATKDGVVQLDEMEHAEEFEAFQGPDLLVDVLVDRPESQVRGRKARTKEAAHTSPNTAKAEVIWTGFRRGKTTATLEALRKHAKEDVLSKYSKPTIEQPTVRTVRRPAPRYHRAKPPVIGLRNFGKPNRFLNDGRFEEDGTLACLWTEEIAQGFGLVFRGERYVPSLNTSHVPDVANRILYHHFCKDPYLAPWTLQAIAATEKSELVGATQNRLMGELALRYDKNGVYDGTVPIARSGNGVSERRAAQIGEEMLRFSLMGGRELSPVAVTSWVQPWCPVWLEWEVEIELGEDFEGWTLGRMDFEGKGASEGQTHRLQGRSAITSGLARTYQAAISEYLVAEGQRDEAGNGEIGDGHADDLGELAGFLEKADLGSVTLDGLSDLWLGLPMGPDGQIPEGPEPISLPQAFVNKELPRLISSGKLRITRARIVDTFGRHRELETSKITLPAALESETSTGARAMAMPPRLSLPSRLMWRFVDPSDDRAKPREASLDQNQRSAMINPIAGYILPDFMDESLEFFDQEGNPLGEVLHDPLTGGVVWEGAVGREGPSSASPMDRLPDTARACGRIAAGMIARDVAQRNTEETAGAETPISAFLRAVDTTMWSVDSELASAGASIAGLVGKPIAVVTSSLWIDIPTDLTKKGIYDDDEAVRIQEHLIKQEVYEKVKSRAFQVRLGELAKGHDGLYGFFIGDDFSQLHLIEKEVSRASRGGLTSATYRRLLGHGVRPRDPRPPQPDVLDAPYITGGEPLELHSGQRIRLTLLMQPTARVHATTGFLPRKALELLRDWVNPGLTRVAPSARVGPVLIDPDKVRLPKIAGFGANQSWTRRNTPLTWRDDPILAATQAAVLPTGRVTVEEGYIRIAPDPEEEGS